MVLDVITDLQRQRDAVIKGHVNRYPRNPGEACAIARYTTEQPEYIGFDAEDLVNRAYTELFPDQSERGRGVTVWNDMHRAPTAHVLQVLDRAIQLAAKKEDA